MFPLFALGASRMGDVFLLDHLKREKEVLQDCVNALTIE